MLKQDKENEAQVTEKRQKFDRVISDDLKTPTKEKIAAKNDRQAIDTTPYNDGDQDGAKPKSMTADESEAKPAFVSTWPAALGKHYAERAAAKQAMN